jgi:tetratricopeptide (TPR) repeat protein
MIRFALAALLPALLFADAPKEQPVGLVLSPGDAKVLRSGSVLPLAARFGDILFSGDSLRSADQPAAFLFCPDQARDSIAPKSDVLFQPKQLKFRAGSLASKQAAGSCLLPETVRVSIASQQHYGVTMVRELHPAAPSQGSFESRLQALPAADRARLTADLQPIGNASDAAALVAKAAIFEKYNLRYDALDTYRKLAALWPDAVWVRSKIFDLEQALALADARAAARNEGGRTYALLVGISHYQRLGQDQWLQYAHKDAELFQQHLRSARNDLPSTDIELLENETATTAAIRNRFETFLKARAGKKDTVVLFIAAHGTMEPGKGAFIVTYDSDPQDLASTALPMADVQKLIDEDLSKVGRVLAFVDVCHAANIGSIHSSTVNSAVEKLGEAQGEILGLMASRPREFSLEGPEFQDHGAFTYFLVKGLQGEADKSPKDGSVDVNEIIEYVRSQVAAATHDKQHPRDFGNAANELKLANITGPGIQIALFPTLWTLAFQGPPQGLAADRGLRVYHDALAAGRLLPDVDDSAFAYLPALKRTLAPSAYLSEENRLRIALEDRGQQVLLRYLTGDEIPQQRVDFDSGAQYFAAARRLTPESLFLAGREDFCRGRAGLFAKDFSGSGNLLEQAARLDPNGAYSYNALGIAYLEQANYTRATLAFRDAIQRAPYWAYPRHNLALAYSEMGDYASAIRSYREAMKAAPKYSYLPYNLGLLYQRLNRRKDAEIAYNRARDLAPASGEPLNALGSLKAEMGKTAEAERLYRQALETQPDLLAARHNLALLLSAEPGRAGEAIQLWQQNIAQHPDYLPSRISLAETLAAQGKTAAAEAQYREILRQKPAYVAARLALADALMRDHQYQEAQAELDRALSEQPANAQLYERKGDIARAAGDQAAARQAYQQALDHTTEGAVRKRLRKKLTE